MQTAPSCVFVRTTGENTDFRKMVNALDNDLYLRNGDTQKQYEQYNQIDKITHAVVIYSDGLPVGCGCFKQFNSRNVEMKRMFVLQEMRGKKLGSQMLQELETWAVEEGYHAAVLETGVRQVEAQRLYTAAGYQLTENYGQYLGMPDSICYLKELKQYQ